jgi:peptidoglycan hydrolase-like protein with peptidoglycan-binding domain
MGSSGFWVGVAQRDLTVIGYPLQDTGYYGPAMKKQVSRFKAHHGLSKAGGLGPRAWHVLVLQVKREQRIRFRPAHINWKGLAVAPASAPGVVKRVIAAANRIAFKPYIYGGGHASWNSPGYDCSGSVSYALHGGGLIWYPEDSSELESYGAANLGKWMTLYTNAGHVYMHLDGLWFDTAAQQWGSYGRGDRWSRTRIEGSSGYMMRHPFRF